VSSCLHDYVANLYLIPLLISCGSHSIQILKRVPEMRVGHVCRVNLTKLPSQTLLLFFGDATLKSLLVAATVLPHVVASPDNDQQEFKSKDTPAPIVPGM